jgi:DNA-binding MarR family transcriptional regulator
MTEYTGDLMEQFVYLKALFDKYYRSNFRNWGPMSNPHHGQGRILSILKLQPQISQKELGYLLDMRNQSLVELLAKLEKSGCITRTPSEEDRRTSNIQLTEAGAKAAEHAEENPPEHDLFSGLDPAEQQQLRDCLNKLIVSLEQKVGAAPRYGLGIPELIDYRMHHHHHHGWGHRDGAEKPRGPHGFGGFGRQQAPAESPKDPALAQYLAQQNCDACESNCSLDDPRCGQGRKAAKLAKKAYDQQAKS